MPSGGMAIYYVSLHRNKNTSPVASFMTKNIVIDQKNDTEEMGELLRTEWEEVACLMYNFIKIQSIILRSIKQCRMKYFE